MFELEVEIAINPYAIFERTSSGNRSFLDLTPDFRPDRKSSLPPNFFEFDSPGNLVDKIEAINLIAKTKLENLKAQSLTVNRYQPKQLEVYIGQIDILLKNIQENKDYLNNTIFYTNNEILVYDATLETIFKKAGLSYNLFKELNFCIGRELSEIYKTTDYQL